MRIGRKMRRDREVVTPEATSGDSHGGAGNVADISPAHDDGPAGQLSFDGLDEPAEILVRISPEALAGEEEIVESDEAPETEEPAAATEVELLAGEVAEPEPTAPAAPEPEPAAPVEPDPAEEELAEVVAVPEAEPAVPESAAPVEPEPAELAAVAEHETDEVEPDEAVEHEEPGLAEAGAVVALEIDDPSLQIRLARIHLKTGSLAMARGELETLAGRGQLDTGALLDLAEVRWRTGDLNGAGDAAASYLGEGGDEALGFVIAAEAAAFSNRLEEARAQSERALVRHMAELDPVFAGMPRKAKWSFPGWSGAVAQAAAVASAAPAAPSAALAPSAPVPVPVPVPAQEPTAPVPAQPVEPAPAQPVEVAPAQPVEPAPAQPVEVAPAQPVEPAGPTLETRRAGAEVSSGRSSLDANDPMMAALHFGVAIRIAPESARSVLDEIGDRQDLPLQLVRGDALRILGLQGDAGRAYLSVANALWAPKSVPGEVPLTAEGLPTAPPDLSGPAAEPQTPAAPAEPQTPAAPAEPETPAAPAEPETPAAPAEPETPAAPA
ncbi:MAG: hypothetical protein ACHQ01_06820, partial [Candidatus Limnocylindrales bacterium]